MKFKPFTIVLVIASGILIVSNWEAINNFLGIFGIGVWAIVLYFTSRIIDNRVDKLLTWIWDKLGLTTRAPKHIHTLENKQRYQRLLDGLCQNVESLCQANINLIQEGDLKFIDSLNWNVSSKGKEYVFKGKLSEVVFKFQGQSIGNFAVIGEAGVGKTSAIYDFILERLRGDNRELIPVYFSLSTWKKNQSLEDWLKRELGRVYHLDKKVSEYFIKDFKIFPFLDGLDQMTQEMRERCILEIYEYSKNNPLALTSRPGVFEEILEYLKNNDIHTDYLFDTYSLKPLSAKQVQEITGEMASRNAFKEVFDASPKLRNFAKYPMALFILTKIINDISATEITELEESSDEELFHRLWKKYDTHIFSDTEFKKQRNITINPSSMRNWLKKIANDRDSSFYIEELQPLFLSSNMMRKQYYLISRLVQGIAIAISVGFFMSGAFDMFPAGILSGFIAAFLILLIKDKDISVVGNHDFKLKFNSKENKLRSYLINIGIHLLPLLFILCLYFGLSTPRSPDIPGEMRMNGTFSTTETNVGFLIAVLMALIFGFRTSWQNLGFDIRLIEKMSRDWKKFFQYGIFGGCFLGVFLIGIALIFNTFFSDSGFGIWLSGQTYLPNPYIMAFVVGLLFGFCLFGIIGYLKEQDTLLDKEEKKRIFKPNIGIHRTFSNAFKAGLFVTLIMMISYGAFILVIEDEMTSIVKAMKTSIAFGVLGFLWFGGLDAISHYCLRMIIYFDNSGPLQYSRFLEQASNLRFVRIVGSGYEFMHPTIKEYFFTAKFKPLKNRKLKVTIIPIVCLLCVLPIFMSLYARFDDGGLFWKSELHGLQIHSKSPLARKINHSNIKLVIQGLEPSRTLDLEFKANGKIKVGSFTGFVDAGGTEGGFFGMGLKDIYDKPGLQSYQHGVLALRKKGEPLWRAFPDTDIYDVFTDTKKLFLRVKNNDSIEFLINDAEFNNNSGTFFVTIDTTKIHNKMNIISHRGAAGLAPENTLSAIEKGLSLKVDKIEIDVHLSKDGQLIIMHDKKVDRTTNGKGAIANLDEKEIKGLTIINEFDETDKSLKVPTLSEVFTLVKPSGTKLLIEIKNPKLYPGIDVALYELIVQYEMQDQVEVFSFDSNFVNNFKMANPDIYVGQFLISPFGTGNIENVDAVGIYYHSLLFRKAFLGKMHEKGIKVYAWSVNTQRGMQRLLEMKVDGIITDHPDLLKITMGF